MPTLCPAAEQAGGFRRSSLAPSWTNEQTHTNSRRRCPPGSFFFPPLAVPLRLGAVQVLGRRTHESLNNLHISREHVKFEITPDYTGKVMIRMTNVRTET